MNSKRKIAIIIDNPLRDLPACALLAAELAQDFDVYLTPMSQAATDLFLISPDLVLLNYLRVTNLPLVKKLIQTGIAWSVLDTEGGIFMKLENSEETSYTKTLIKDADVRNQISHYFFWGEDLHGYMEKNKIYPADRMFCLGTPRMDFYHSNLRSYFLSPEMQAESNRRPMILINTSFSANNPKFSSRDLEAKMLVSKFNYEPSFVNQLFQNLDNIMKEYIELTKYLAKEFPQVDFVLRPHPFENLDAYREPLQNFKNVKVDCTDTVARWIWQSKALIHYECSTALESAFAGRPSFSLGQFRHIRPLESVQSITDYVESKEAMKERISAVLEGRYQLGQDLQKNLARVETGIYYKVDGQAYLRIAEKIRDWFTTHSTGRSFQKKSAIWYYAFRQQARSALKKIAKGYLVPPEKQIRSEDMEKICQNLGRVFQRPVSFQRLPFSSSVQIHTSTK